MLRIGVLVSGGGTNLQAIINGIESGEIKAKLCCVISNKKNAYALERARDYNIPAYCIRKKDFSSIEEYESYVIDTLNKNGCELIVLAGFLVVLGETFVRAFENHIINVHPSLIPSFCGKGFYGIKVHEEVLSRGVKVTGATVHFVDLGTDTGPIILQKAVEVCDGDTPEILQKRVMEEAEQIICPHAIQLYAEGRLLISDNRVKITDGGVL